MAWWIPFWAGGAIYCLAETLITLKRAEKTVTRRLDLLNDRLAELQAAVDALRRR